TNTGVTATKLSTSQSLIATADNPPATPVVTEGSACTSSACTSSGPPVPRISSGLLTRACVPGTRVNDDEKPPTIETSMANAVRSSLYCTADASPATNTYGGGDDDDCASVNACA